MHPYCAAAFAAFAATTTFTPVKSLCTAIAVPRLRPHRRRVGFLADSVL
ncbi:MAG: hypothetical protein ABR910_11385 [Acidobacteriaceae bacterium]|jgi:hypothetical protein